MGGRGAGAGWGGGGGGVNPPISSTSLISAREGKEAEVDQVLSVLRDVMDSHGVSMNDVELGKFPPGATVMGYYDPSTGALGINASYFDGTKIESAYDNCVKSGFHPGRGGKTGMEAVAAHEAGHRLTYVAAQKAGLDADAFSENIVDNAAKSLRYKNSANMAKKISGYALESRHEAIAEAFADVYCNGNGAKRESHAIVKELQSRL